MDEAYKGEAEGKVRLSERSAFIKKNVSVLL
jgi:hypothetical protein